MALKIWKFDLAVKPKQTLKLPESYTIMDVQVLHGKPCAWILCEEIQEEDVPNLQDVIIDFHGTGHDLPENPGEYITSFQAQDGNLMVHVFVGTEPEPAEVEIVEP